MEESSETKLDHAVFPITGLWVTKGGFGYKYGGWNPSAHVVKLFFGLPGRLSRSW